MKAAIESFAQKGFSGTKTKDIAAVAGVSEAILFRHFASKEDLYDAILDTKENPELKSRMALELEALMAKRDDARFFETLAVSVIESFREDPAFHRLLLYALLEGHLLASLFRERFGQPLWNFLRRYIQLRQKEGAFVRCDVNIAIKFFFGAVVHYAMTRYLFEVNIHPAEDRVVAKKLVQLVMRGLKK